MTLLNKAAIESEYVQKRDAVRAITQAGVNTALAGIDGFVVQCTELIEVLRAREALNARQVESPAVSELSGKAADIASKAAGIRSAVAEIQALVPD